ncbi:MAG: hypothetical protein R2864_06080 [Syntrophotaleaceae bacterium]
MSAGTLEDTPLFDLSGRQIEFGVLVLSGVEIAAVFEIEGRTAPAFGGCPPVPIGVELDDTVIYHMNMKIQ